MPSLPRAIRLAPLALIAVAVVWGGAFVVMKPAIESQPIVDFLGTRFVLAAGVMIAVRPSVLRRFRGPLLWQGVTLGTLMTVAYVTQTVGLKLTTAAISGFVTGLYVVLSPLLIWLLLKVRVAAKVWIAVVVSLFGLAFISIDPATLSFDWAQLWLVACAVFFSLHIAGLAKWSPGQDAFALTVIQLATVGVLCMVWASFQGYHPPADAFGWFAILFTAVFSTAIAFFVQTWAQGVMDSSRVAIYLTSEVVFAALIAVAVGQETLSVATLVGGSLIVLAMLVVEWPSRSASPLPVENLPH
ncbi:MAG TPA: DMT family transporter [Microbacteriaceae bacterium]|nr:DMT family transporter [Microbacteriaceae bacterium]